MCGFFVLAILLSIAHANLAQQLHANIFSKISGNAAKPLYNSLFRCRGGGIGRRTGLKIPRRKACRFDSGPRHQEHLAPKKSTKTALLQRCAVFLFCEALFEWIQGPCNEIAHGRYSLTFFAINRHWWCWIWLARHVTADIRCLYRCRARLSNIFQQ